METFIRTITGSGEDDRIYREAADVIRSGGLVAFPTETVYGLGGDGLDPDAARKIYEAKGRPSDNPLILHVAAFSQIPPLVREIPEKARRLMEAFWPGPLTIILPKSDLVPSETTGGLSTVALRMPDHPVAQAFLKAADCPIAAPSANLSGRPSPTNARDVWEDLNGRIPLILDGGESRIGLESTIVDLSGPVPTLLRPGFYSLQQVKRVLGTAAVDPAVFGALPADVRPKAPGMKYRHYAPNVPLILVEGEDRERAETIQRLADPAKKTAVLVTEETLPLYGDAADLLLIPLGSRRYPEGIAHRLFTTLRALDHLQLDLVYSETFEEGPMGMAVMNRLRKAAGFHIIGGKDKETDNE
ncbi:MAG: threonylcarbamoyl-AMP synthase [Lachnospiraceae bacterium]|nr:threonylcarbamoyl-AMP synthase [Lachnospiraceae bacterium]